MEKKINISPEILGRQSFSISQVSIPYLFLIYENKWWDMLWYMLLDERDCWEPESQHQAV